MQTYTHWRLEKDEDHVAWLYFDKQNASVNTMDHLVMEELSTIIDALAQDTECKGLIIASAKTTGFIAGADISLFTTFSEVDEAVSVLKRGQHIFNKLEALKISTVAMIDGFCLGGGMELALACHHRVAEDGSKTRLGLPEIKLGIHPGWGGTVRLPRLIGAVNGLNLILSAHAISGKAAAKLGIVDIAVPKRHLATAAKFYALGNAKPRQATRWQNLTNISLVRPLLAKILRKKLRAKADPHHYPAPFYVVDNWERVGVAGDAAMEREAKSCGKLFFNDTCRNLVRLYHLQERLKGLGKESRFEPRHVHVVGAGTMGGDIAAWCALQGLRVTLQDREAKFIAPAISRAYQLFKEKLKEPHLIQQAMDRLMPDVEGHGVQRADIVIEAIFEDLATKQALFKALEAQAKPQAILATNTSSIPLDDINSVLQNPGRLVGIHYFNPVAKMQLVEVVKGERTDPAIVEKATSFVRKIDRLPLPVKSSPGFLVNRILMPYLLEAVTMLSEGIPAPVIDHAMVTFGMPMGPVTLADTVGLDVCLSVAKYLTKYFNSTIPARLSELVEKGKLGRKSGEGFYHYTKGKQVKVPLPNFDKPLESISDRLVLRMVDEAFACLREEVVADSDLLDAGMVFGTGFAPFFGGPINYAKTKGISELFQQFIKIRQQHGEQINSLKNWESSTEEP